MKTNAFIRVSVFFLLMAVISSCGLFRKKNKCMDCPKWSKEASALEYQETLQQEK